MFSNNIYKCFVNNNKGKNTLEKNNSYVFKYIVQQEDLKFISALRKKKKSYFV